jgi:cbb3-type cytochrome oxidase subunit 3
MLRFIQHNLTTIGNVEYFPIISLVLFSLFFVLVAYRVYKMPKSSIEELSQIPLNDKTLDSTKK